jgi:hypothetical protein
LVFDRSAFSHFTYLQFQDQSTYAVLQVALYIPATLRHHNRNLRSNEAFDYRQDYIQFIKDPQLRDARKLDMKDRSLLIGGGSEPRETLLLNNVQFLNNSLTPNIEIPSLAVNGPLDIFTAFTDVTVNNCLFKDNYYPRSQTIFVRNVIVCCHIAHIHLKNQLTEGIFVFSPQFQQNRRVVMVLRLIQVPH